MQILVQKGLTAKAAKLTQRVFQTIHSKRACSTTKSIPMCKRAFLGAGTMLFHKVHNDLIWKYNTDIISFVGA
jgi:hypothetical protein